MTALPCRDVDLADLFPGDDDTAQALCASCPIRVDCLTDALERHEPWGVWGGHVFDNGKPVRRKAPAKPSPTPSPPAPEGLLPHGTHAAFNRHRKKGEAACMDCFHAERTYQRERNRRNRASRRQAA